MSVNNTFTIFGSVSLKITTRLGQCDTCAMYWPTLQPSMRLMTTLLSPKNMRQRSINDYFFVISDNHISVQQHEALITVLALFIGLCGFHDIATTS
jgi:hypothetical protein